MKILINRSDNLGDIVYTLQLAGLLKKFKPSCTVFFLVRDYAAPMFNYATDVDGTLSWDSLKTLSSKERNKVLKKFDVFINARSQSKMAWFAFLAGIKTRIGNSRRWYNFLLCNNHVAIKHKGLQSHEAEFNARFLEPLIGKTSYTAEELFNFIQLDKSKAHMLSLSLPTDKTLVICHPASNGNGREWPLENFIELINITDLEGYHFILTGSVSEKNQSDNIEHACPNVSNLAGKLSLNDFIALIASVDVLIASGTGPLHIAAALGIKTIGLFPPIHALNTQRWGPLFPKAINLELNKACEVQCQNNDCACMKNLLPQNVLLNIQSCETVIE